jgi:uncharacterized peroxidase-related enzyme
VLILEQAEQPHDASHYGGTRPAPNQENPMSRIPAIELASATGSVKSLLDGVQKGLGATPNLFRVAAQSPAVLEGMVGLFGAVAKGKLGARVRESIALTVSEVDACDYCLSAHTALGKGAGLTEEAMTSARDARAEDPRVAATLHFARLVTEKRGHVAEGDVVEARRAGLSDADLVEVVANVALTTFTNYLNEVAGTEIDFPVIAHRAR